MYLDIEKAQGLIDSAIAEMGEDYVYPMSKPGNGNTCSYVDERWDSGVAYYDPPILIKGCIVGHAFINAGLDMEKLYNSEHNDEGSNALLDWLKESGFLSGFDEDARHFLALVQRSQDFGAPWGEAVRQAKESRALNSSRTDYVLVSNDASS